MSAFPYIGGKTRLAQWVIDHLPPHTCYVEPFGGSASVLLNKPRSDVEVFNDKDRDVVTFFRVARERPEDLAEWCTRVPFSEQLHSDWADSFFDGERPEDDVEHAGQWLFLRYSQYAGKVARKSGFKRESPLDERGSRNARNWMNAPERIDEVAERFRGVSIAHEDYLTILERYDSPETVYYLDPPYWKKEDLYRESAEHEALEAALCDVEADVLVSYTEIPPDLYTGEQWRVIEREAVHSAAGTGKMATERLITNFEPSTELEFNQRSLAEAVDRAARTDGGGRRVE